MYIFIHVSPLRGHRRLSQERQRRIMGGSWAARSASPRPTEASTRRLGRHCGCAPKPGTKRLLRRRPSLQGGSGSGKLRTARRRFRGSQPCAAWRSGALARLRPRAGVLNPPWRQVNYRKPHAPRPQQHHAKRPASSPRRTRIARRVFLSLPPKRGSCVRAIT